MSRRSEVDEARRPLLGFRSEDPDSGGDAPSEKSPDSTDDRSDDQPKLSYEEAVEEAGFGLFHGLLLLVCGWANASDAVEILCVSFLLPTARCDLQLSSADMGLLTASIFLGMMLGGYMWGYLADQRGRQRVLVISLAVNGTFGAVASLAPSFWLFLLLRFLSGVGVGGSIPVIFSYFSEFQPKLRRGAMISALATFWMAGNILAAGAAWLVIPRTFLHVELGWLDFQSWRVFVVLCSIPSLTSAFIFSLAMPESPRFLIEVGMEEEALTVFQLMYKLNHRGSCKPFPASGLLVNRKDDEDEVEPLRMRGCCEHLTCFFKQGLAPIRQLFVRSLLSRSIALLIINYCISFGYYGLWMWFPELFKRAEDGGSPCANMSQPQSQENESCYPVKTAVYMEGFVTAASNLPGNIFTILLMDVVGGKILLAGSLLLSSVSVFLIYVVKTKSQSLLMSCVFSGVSVISWNALDVVSTELYPTQLRSSALGFFTGVGRVAAIMGNVVFGQLVDSNCAVPILVVSALLLAGGLAALKLPPTKQTDLT
ncbi:synaptic vesicle glycoprotein 2C isoform X1 [Pygocentrus nattereri]|uniref:Major facilitator superfamily (MFS) profile domain-containing protein n=1 Tax=Pygocentrus nattereri TaxID=42514 RepID=A0A3B4DCQ9_PYGNA|nr:synaptic vesicle glycoprotein 2C isoform X1 [Pygocentrus nattereri]